MYALDHLLARHLAAANGSVHVIDRGFLQLELCLCFKDAARGSEHDESFDRNTHRHWLVLPKKPTATAIAPIRGGNAGVVRRLGV